MKRPSPPPVTHYSDHEASNISEKIKHDESFTKALQASFLNYHQYFYNLILQITS